MNQLDKQKLTFDALDTEDLLAGDNVFVVPKYQRGYSWQEEHVNQILDDLHASFESRPSDTYLLGQIITCPSQSQRGKEKTSDLIDGQQRISTLFLILLAGLRMVSEEDISGFGARKRSIFTKTKVGMFWFDEDAEDEDEREVQHPRVLPASDGLSHFNALIKTGILPSIDTSPTQENIRTAWETITDFYENVEVFPSPESVWSFIDYLLHQVRVINLQLDNINQALEVFIRVNDRGLELDNADLLKGLLFQRVNSQRDYEHLSRAWSDATSTLYGAKLARLTSMEFLLRLLAAIRNGSGVRTAELFDVWQEALADAESAKSFGTSLPRRATSLQRISSKRSPIDDDELNLNITYESSLLRMIQHYEVLLAGDHLSPETFRAVLRMTEERAVLSTLAGEPKQDFERAVHGWAKAVSELESDADGTTVKESLAAMVAGLEDLYVSLPSQLAKLNYSTTTHHKKIRYVLARVSRYVQEAVDSQDLPLSVYMQTTRRNGHDRGYELDHIFPKSTSQRSHWKHDEDGSGADEPSPESVLRSIHSIGNLTLLHPRDNYSQSDSLPWSSEKVGNLASSGLWLNRLLVPSQLSLPGAANDEKFNRWTSYWVPDLSSWGTSQVANRTDFIAELLVETFRATLG